MTGRTCDPLQVPTLFGEQTWKKNPLVKIVSGAHHSLALCKNGKVFAWGDAESGKIGRMLNSRSKNTQAMKIESVGAKRAKDIFCGNHASFYLNDKGQLFAWGLNNHGQLGIGNKMNTCTPTYVYALDGIPVKEVAGGEHHTLCVTEDGRVFCWGRNDEGQCGVGDLFG
jgi:alpha-tubulin suppressor-like RCC1 family protein